MHIPDFEEVAELVRECAGLSASKPILPQTRFEFDLGVTGDDGVELLQAAERRFGVTFTPQTFSLAPNEFLFGPEASILDIMALFRRRPTEVRSFTVGALHEAILKELKRNDKE